MRKAYRSLCTHGCAVLVGAIVSDARFHVMMGDDIEPCQWRGTQEIPSWDHLVWSCPAFACTRCVLPEDPLQRILGWPTGHNEAYDAAVLHHLITVRQQLLDRRYRAI